MQHKAIRYGDEYQCSTCGKAWGIDEPEIPDCCDNGPTFDESPSIEISMLKAQVAGLKTLIQVNEHRMNIPRNVDLNWTPKEWYNYLNIIKLRDTINTHE